MLLLAGCAGGPGAPPGPDATVSCEADCPTPPPTTEWSPLPCDADAPTSRGVTAPVNPGFAGPLAPIARRLADALEDALVPAPSPNPANRTATFHTLNGTLELSREANGQLAVHYATQNEWVERNATNASARVRTLVQSLSFPPQPQLPTRVDERPESRLLVVDFHQAWQNQALESTQGTLRLQGATPQGAPAETTLFFASPFKIRVERNEFALAKAVSKGETFLRCEFDRTHRSDGPSDDVFSFQSHGLASRNASLSYALLYSHEAPPPPSGIECASPSDWVYVDAATGAVLEWRTDRFCEPSMGD